MNDNDTQSLLSRIGDQEVKEQLKATTQKAIDLGVSTNKSHSTFNFCFIFSPCEQ